MGELKELEVIEKVDKRVFSDYAENITAINEIAVTANVKIILNDNYVVTDLYNADGKCIAVDRRITRPVLTKVEIDKIKPPKVSKENVIL